MLVAGYQNRPYSRTIVTGPSFTSSTDMRAPKAPVSTWMPRSWNARAHALVLPCVRFAVRLEVLDPRCVGLGARFHRARKLVVPVRLGLTAQLLERSSECVMRVVVGGLELFDDRSELRFRFLPSGEPEIGDAERL